MQLADAAGLHINAVSFVERGLRDPQLSTLVALARALDAATPGRARVTVARLMEGVE